MYLVALQIHLLLIKLLALILIKEEPKPVFLIPLVALSLTSLIIFFRCYLYFHVNSMQFDMDIAKINFVMIYLTGVIQY